MPEEVLGKMKASPKSDVPIITANELLEADRFLYGFPTRFGMMATQFKAFMDTTGDLWCTQKKHILLLFLNLIKCLNNNSLSSVLFHEIKKEKKNKAFYNSLTIGLRHR